MSKEPDFSDSISLQGLSLAPPQVLGGVRLVPVLRDEVRDDLRLTRRRYNEDGAVVELDRTTAYYSYVPHAFVASWQNDGSPAVAYGTQIKKHKPGENTDGDVYDFGWTTVRVIDRMRRRENKQALRFLPMHMSMEGFLSLHFGGPEIAWEEYSNSALRDGLSPRGETSVPGRCLVGLEDALRVFEIHDNQVGVLVFVADTLASAFVVPHPDDYKQLHETLLTDFYGELLFYYGFYATENDVQPSEIEVANVSSIADLRGELDRVRQDWSELHQRMSNQLLDRGLMTSPIYKMGPFQMNHFMTDMDPKSENHIGEMIVRGDGTVEYLKTFRLSAAQCRRAYLLMKLAEHGWNLADCAASFDCTKHQLVYRLENAGFGYLLHQHVLDAAKASRRTN